MSTHVIILAAGHGTRMKSALPKVMHELHEKPLIGHIVDAVDGAGVTERPIVVVSPNSTSIREYLADRVDYAVQEEQRGTGDAVAAAQSALPDSATRVVVLYSDLPFLTSASIRSLVDQHTGVLSMLTTTVPDFDDQHQSFYSFGRIIRDNDGKVLSITEMKDCSDEQRHVRELNTGLYCFDALWLWEHLPALSNKNAQGEYYLTDLVALAIADGHCVQTVDLDPKESFGITSQEDLIQAASL